VVENTPRPVIHPTPAPTQKPSSSPVSASEEDKVPSLKEALIKTRTVVKREEERKRNNPFTQEQLMDTWTALASHVADKPRLATALQKVAPVLKENNIVSFSMWNELQKAWMENNEIVLNFLRDTLQNDGIRLDITVDAESAKVTTPYTHDEKFRFLVTQYPAVAQLKQDMTLDIR
jgi:hypothetical protein